MRRRKEKNSLIAKSILKEEQRVKKRDMIMEEK